MKIIIVDTDDAFTTAFSQRCAENGAVCQVFLKPALALQEIRKNPDAVDLVVIARELNPGGAEAGLATAKSIREDAKIADVPYIIISADWSKADFARHQRTPLGANAYFSKKSPHAELDGVVGSVLGVPFGAKSTSVDSHDGDGADRRLDIVVEEASIVLNVTGNVTREITLTKPIDILKGTPAKHGTVPAKQGAVPVPATAHRRIDIPIETTQSKPASVKSPSEKTGLLSKERKVEKALPPVGASASGPEIDLGGSKSAISIDLVPNTSEPMARTAVDVVSAAIEIESPSVAAAAVVMAEKPQPETRLPSSEPLGAVSRPPATAEPTVGPEPISEEEAAKDLPYLFSVGSGNGTVAGARLRHDPQLLSPGTSVGIPIGIDRVGAVRAPGSPVANPDDIETLKRYLMMREQDVSLLTAQLSYAKEELAKSEDTIKRLTLQNEDLLHQINGFKEKVASQDLELQYAGKSRDGEVEQLRLEVKSKIDRIKFLEERLIDSGQQYEKLKERVRLDIRKIRVREKELESKLEILKKDSETLIAARENKILELKRKIDLLEFNYDSLQDKNDQEKQNVQKAREKLDRVLKVIRLAMGIIDATDEDQQKQDELVAAAGNRPGPIRGDSAA